MLSVVQQSYVHSLSGMYLAYVHALPIQQSMYAKQKVVFLEELHQNGLADV
jgi:hypothetical protein